MESEQRFVEIGRSQSSEGHSCDTRHMFPRARANPIILATLMALVVGGVEQASAATKPTKTRIPSPTLQAGPWKVLAVKSRNLEEVSGCAFSKRDSNRVWLHNDSGDGPTVIPVDIKSGAVGPSVTISGVEVDDPEDIAMTSNGDLILADIGDNDEKRSSIQLYRFPEPVLDAVSASGTRLDFEYPDGPHNAEALVVSPDGSRAYIFTKESSGEAEVFQANLNGPKEPGSTASTKQVLSQMGRVTLRGERIIKPNLVTGADAVGSTVILRSYQYGYILSVPKGGQISDAIKATPQRFDVPPMVQAEAICASTDGRTLVTASESRGADTFALAVGLMPR